MSSWNTCNSHDWRGNSDDWRENIKLVLLPTANNLKQKSLPEIHVTVTTEEKTLNCPTANNLKQKCLPKIHVPVMNEPTL